MATKKQAKKAEPENKTENVVTENKAENLPLRKLTKEEKLKYLTGK